MGRTWSSLFEGAEGGTGFGQLDVAFPELFRIGGSEVGAQQIGAFAHLLPGAALMPHLPFNGEFSVPLDDAQFIETRNLRMARLHGSQLPLDLAAVERLTADAAYDDQAAFSPDGGQIVFVSTRAEGFANLWVLDLASRKLRALTMGKGGDFRPAWSPDGRWIAFSSDRDSSLPTATNRWERLQLVDIYLMHPDGSGLRRISRHGDFCGSPKWTPDSKNVVTYCMSAQDTWTDRTKLLSSYADDAANQVYSIDIATGAMVAVTTGPGVKLAPSVLSKGSVAYMRGEGARIEIVSADGKTGPSGADLAANPAAWSPDGRRVVYCRATFRPNSGPVHQWSRNPDFDLYATTEPERGWQFQTSFRVG